MPPKVDVATLIAKRDSTIGSLYDLLEEFNVLFGVQPMKNILENVYKEVEIKYRSVKKKQEAIADKLYEVSPEGSEELEKVNQELGEKAKVDFLHCSEKFATYQKACNVKKSSVEHNALDVMAEAVTKMAEVLGSQKNVNHGLKNYQFRRGMATEKLMPLGNANSNIGWSNINKTMTNNFSVSEKRSQKTLFGLIKLSQVRQ